MAHLSSELSKTTASLSTALETVASQKNALALAAQKSAPAPAPSTARHIFAPSSSTDSSSAALRQEHDALRARLATCETALDAALAENTELYDAFNEELEQMYADATLPNAEAHVAMKRDIQITKADRNALRLENACVLHVLLL